MVDETVSATPVAQTNEGGVTAPVTVQPVAEVVAEQKPQTVLGGEPVSPKAEAKSDEAANPKPAEIADAAKPSGEKTADAGEPKPAEVKSDAVDTKPSAEEVALPTYEEFKFPEGFEKDDAKISQFNKDLAEFEKTSKASHAEVQAFGQKLVDKFAAELKDSNERLAKYYNDTFEKQKKEWREGWENDSELGGNRKDTTRNFAVRAVESFGGTAEQKTQFRQFVEATGVGDNPALIRLITNMQAKIDSLTQESGKMLPAKAPAPQSRSKIATRYGNS